MIYRKKLIEVALPLEALNMESAREKSIRHGHPSTFAVLIVFILIKTKNQGLGQG
jgi:hypothetical protein